MGGLNTGELWHAQEGAASWQYHVLEVESSQALGAMHVRLLRSDGSACVTCALHDGWQDTPLAPGEAVNLLAPVQEGPQGLLATCNWREGTFLWRKMFWACTGEAVNLLAPLGKGPLGLQATCNWQAGILHGSVFLGDGMHRQLLSSAGHPAGRIESAGSLQLARSYKFFVSKTC